MRNPDRETTFRFKRFEVENSRSAMKVGTDGVLLGAWAFGDKNEERVCGKALDVGTGSGLIALMLAQRFGKMTLKGIEVDHEAAGEARKNFDNSPWGNRLEAIEGDFCAMAEEEGGFDFMVSNPPYFSNGALAPDEARRTARHEGVLNWASLMRGAKMLLKPTGRLALVAPFEAMEMIMFEGEVNGFKCIRRCVVRTVNRKPARRVLLEFERGVPEGLKEESELCIHAEGGGFSEEYMRLTGDFYLNF